MYFYKYSLWGGVGSKRGKGIKRYKLLGIKYIRYKDAVYNTGILPIFYDNFIQSTIYKNIKSLCFIPDSNITSQLKS